jgi:hypothetical protein
MEAVEASRAVTIDPNYAQGFTAGHGGKFFRRRKFRPGCCWRVIDARWRLPSRPWRSIRTRDAYAARLARYAYWIERAMADMAKAISPDPGEA